MNQRFDTYEVAFDWAAALRPAMDRIARRDADLGRQLRRAVASVVLNLAEGSKRAGQDRPHHSRIAAGSAAEAKSGLQLGLAWGLVDRKEFDAVAALQDRLGALLWRLTHPRR